jgi:hypothetical protein
MVEDLDLGSLARHIACDLAFRGVELAAEPFSWPEAAGTAVFVPGTSEPQSFSYVEISSPAGPALGWVHLPFT